MIEEPPLLTIKRPSRRPTPEQIAAFQGVPTSVVSDAMEGRGALDASVRHLDGRQSLPETVAGPALTAHCGAADMLALWGALKFMQPGDVPVLAFDGHRRSALFGDRVMGMMRNAGVAGVVTDAPVRDGAGVIACGRPVWCSGVTPASPFSNGPGNIGLPVQLAGQRVETGDMVVGDLDGVVIVPFEQIDAVAARVSEILALEEALDAKVRDDNLVVPEHIDALLDSDRVRYVD